MLENIFNVARAEAKPTFYKFSAPRLELEAVAECLKALALGAYAFLVAPQSWLKHVEQINSLLQSTVRLNHLK